MCLACFSGASWIVKLLLVLGAGAEQPCSEAAQLKALRSLACLLQLQPTCSCLLQEMSSNLGSSTWVMQSLVLVLMQSTCWQQL